MIRMGLSVCVGPKLLIYLPNLTQHTHTLKWIKSAISEQIFVLLMSMPLSRRSPTRIVYSSVRFSTVMGFVARLKDGSDRYGNFWLCPKHHDSHIKPRHQSHEPLTKRDQCDHSLHLSGAQPSILTPKSSRCNDRGETCNLCLVSSMMLQRLVGSTANACLLKWILWNEIKCTNFEYIFFSFVYISFFFVFLFFSFLFFLYMNVNTMDNRVK